MPKSKGFIFARCKARQPSNVANRPAHVLTRVSSSAVSRVPSSLPPRLPSPVVQPILSSVPDPVVQNGSDSNAGNDELRVNFVINHAWSSSTLNRYDTYVKEFFAFCRACGLHPLTSQSASEDLLCAFAASMAGSRAGGTASAKISAVKAWHIQNDLPWLGSSRLKYTLKGTENMRPPESIKDTRPPVSSDMLTKVRNSLNLEDLEEACIWAIATTAFWAQIRMGELCPKTEQNYDIALTPTWKHFGTPSVTGTRTLHLPKTKRGGTKGETVLVSRQTLLDPIFALENHARINSCALTDSVAAFRGPSGAMVGLTLRRLLRKFNSILGVFNEPRITGHCFRIGGTTMLLLQGIPPDVVKSLGRWSSNAFLRYWRSLELIAPMYVELLKPVMSYLDRR